MSRRHKHEDRLHNNEHQKWRLNNEREVNWQHRELSGLSYLEQVVARAAAILQFSAVIGSIPSIHQKVPCGGGRRCNATPLWIPPVLLDYGTLWTDKKTKTAQAGFNRMSPNTDSLRSSSPLRTRVDHRPLFLRPSVLSFYSVLCGTIPPKWYRSRSLGSLLHSSSQGVPTCNCLPSLSLSLSLYHPKADGPFPDPMGTVNFVPADRHWTRLLYSEVKLV